MARIRTIKPEFFRHEKLFQAEKKSKLPLRIAFAGLWTVADRAGKFKWRPSSIKLDTLPYDSCDMDAVLDALVASGFVEKYCVDGETYGRIPSFGEHQLINHREAKSSLPDPLKNERPGTPGHAHDACSAMPGQDCDASCSSEVMPGHAPGEGKGKEGKGREREREREGVDADASGDGFAETETPNQPIGSAGGNAPPLRAAPPPAEVILPWDTGPFREAWDRWKAYRKAEKNARYKTLESEQQALIRLSEISGGIEATAIKIIKESIGNTWTGLFPIKNNEQRDSKGAAGSGRDTDYERQLAERARRAAGQSG